VGGVQPEVPVACAQPHLPASKEMSEKFRPVTFRIRMNELKIENKGGNRKIVVKTGVFS